MKKLFFALFSLVCLPWNVCAQTDKPSDDAKFGTLIVAIPTKDGLIMCADKRAYSKKKGNNDNFLKLRSISKYKIFGAAGLAEYTEERIIYPSTSLSLPGLNLPLSLTTPSTTLPSITYPSLVTPSTINDPNKTEPPSIIEYTKFDLNGIIESYYRNPNYNPNPLGNLVRNSDGTFSVRSNETETKPTIKGLEIRVAREFESILEDLKKRNDVPDLLVEAHLFYVTSDDQLKQETLFAVPFRDIFGRVENVYVKGDSVDDKEMAVGKPIVWGSPELYMALTDSQNEKFDQVRKTKQYTQLKRNPAINLFLNPKPATQTKPKDALLFARTLIQTTASLDPTLFPEIHVSSNYDCGLLNPSEGFITIVATETQPKLNKNQVEQKSTSRKVKKISRHRRPR